METVTEHITSQNAKIYFSVNKFENEIIPNDEWITESNSIQSNSFTFESDV